MRMLFPLGALFLLTAPGCKTTAPTSDSTPPALEWVVTNRTQGSAFNTQIRINGTGTVNARRGEEYLVTLNARDPQGVKRIELGGSGEYGCGNPSQNSTISQTTDVQNLSPNAQNEVLTQIFLLRDVGFGAMVCQGTFVGGSIRLRGKANNYFNGQAQGQLIFSVSP